MLPVLIVAKDLYDDHGVDCVVTSGLDGKHSTTSLHYSGNALDFRTRNLPGRAAAQDIAAKMREALGHHYDVILETDHIHAGHQPRYDD
jgi:hypothetical protein